MENLKGFMKEVIMPLFITLIGIIIGLALILQPITVALNKGEIEEYKSIQRTIDSARKNKSISEYELAALQQKAVDANRWLASKQYWNKTIFDWYVPDEVDQLRPIE